jgi:hypothetical protein
VRKAEEDAGERDRDRAHEHGEHGLFANVTQWCEPLGDCVRCSQRLLRDRLRGQSPRSL